jgi:hypothetical protein
MVQQVFSGDQAVLQDAQDSRSFGPLPLQNIIGRAIYSSRSAVEHGVVMNRW